MGLSVPPSTLLSSRQASTRRLFQLLDRSTASLSPTSGPMRTDRSDLLIRPRLRRLLPPQPLVLRATHRSPGERSTIGPPDRPTPRPRSAHATGSSGTATSPGSAEATGAYGSTGAPPSPEGATPTGLERASGLAASTRPTGSFSDPHAIRTNPTQAANTSPRRRRNPRLDHEDEPTDA